MPASGVDPSKVTVNNPGVDAAGASFNDVLKGFVQQVDEAQKGFDSAIEAVERGDTDNIHQLMIAQNQAQLTLKLAAEVRNKVVEAYREVMRTQF
ncbi:MAG: flagellar hook-basal body complex protein FliE [Planctomycetota bacterium]|nr:MAG: flagellar hook-basal body complex protein FliE [Planctomycetota bacterium]